MSKHTKGPWIVRSKVIGGVARVNCVGPKGGDLSDQELICMVPETNKEQAANLRLILSAPELFDALHYLLEQTVDADLKYGIELSEGEADARAKALALFAKISGENND